MSLRDRPLLRAKLDRTLENTPPDLRMRIARMATLSAREAHRLLDEAAAHEGGAESERVVNARRLLNQLAAAPPA